MNRDQKSIVIDYLKDNFSNRQALFVVGFKGLSVTQLQSLRSDLREKGGSLKIAKARLMKRAAEGVEGVDQLMPFFKEQVGVVFSDEPPAVAKVLSDFAKENQALSLVVGYLDSRLLEHDSIIRIASLPSKEVLLAQLCGTLQAPISGLARVLNMVPQKLLWALKEIEKQKQ